MTSTAREPVVGPFVKSLLTLDMARSRPVSGIRRAAVVFFVMALAWTAIGPATATSAGMAALLIGFLDRQQSPRVAVRVMIAGTLAMTATHMVADSLSPWPVAVMMVLAGIAFAEGASIVAHPDAPIVLHFCGTIAATAAISEPANANPAASAVAVLVAGTLQTATTALAARFVPVSREVDLAAAEVALVARSLRALAAEPDLINAGTATLADMEVAARSMTTTERAIMRSDLDPYQVELLALILWAADRVRLEAKAVALAGPAGRDPASLDQGTIRTELRAAADTLTLGSQAMRAAPRDRDAAVQQLWDTPGTAWLQAPHVQPALADFEAGIAQLLRERPRRSAPDSTPRAERNRRLRSAVTPGTLPFRLGARIALAVLLAMAAAFGFGLAHASWASNAVLSIFRPDGGATLSRIALRAVAVSAAAIVVVAVAVGTSQNRTALLGTMAIAIYLSYWLGPVNYGLFGFFVTITVLMILAATGLDPLDIAVARWLDTLVGCAVAVVVAFLLPVWQITALPAGLAKLCDNLASWLTTTAKGARAPHDARDAAAMRRDEVLVRDSVSDVLATLRIAKFEPQRAVPVARLRVVFTEIRAGAQAALAAESLLRGGEPADPIAAETAERGAGLATQVGIAVRAGVSPEAPRPAPIPTGSSDDPGGPRPPLQGILARAEARLVSALAVATATEDSATGTDGFEKG